MNNKIVKLGETVDVEYGVISKFWLCKQPSLRKYTNKIYIVLGFIKGKGWATVYNGTLRETRDFINSNR